jgi:hypothetical protein
MGPVEGHVWAVWAVSVCLDDPVTMKPQSMDRKFIVHPSADFRKVAGAYLRFVSDGAPVREFRFRFYSRCV